MKPEDTKLLIAESIKNFSKNDITLNALNFFNTLGYNTERQSPLDIPSYQSFKNYFVLDDSKFNEDKALVSEWSNVNLLFQLTKDEVLKQTSLFDTKQVITKGETQAVIETYLFFVIELKGDSYTRGKLADITREVNKLFPMPVMILFKYNNFLTLSIINRRLHKRDTSKDVLEKVTLIKDILIPSAKFEEHKGEVETIHRAHIEILYDLSFDKLYDQYQFKNFVDLHNAWQKTLDIKELNSKFFKELSNWYFWAADKTVWPDDVEKKKDVRNATNVIRLITRLIFVWFLKEKNLVPYKLFVKKEVEKLLKFSDSNKSAYYKAILQNLFFATLNTEMGTRKFKVETKSSRNPHYFVHNVFRYKKEFINPDDTLKTYFDPIPFLNGGLFECLDDINGTIRIDGFSDRPDNIIKVPDELFFLEKEKEVDLNKIYGTKNKRYKVRGLLEILNSYKFTITENTPIEEEVALDPELLGKVFENLLASYNPETQTTARKQTGSFYTPREIVNYMVDESIIAYLKTKMMESKTSFLQVGIDQTDIFGNKSRTGQLKIEEELSTNRWTDKENELESELRKLISYSEDQHVFTQQESDVLIEAIDNCKILDPACGSGAFPMGVLHKLVHILHKLDPENVKWKELQRKKAVAETEEVFNIDANTEREELLKEINETFDTNINYPDYGRKIYLIENCLFGVDIQPIAVQIAKLRFFISLLIEQKVDWTKPDKNYNIKPLPNLETKIVAANTLISIEKPEGFNFRNKQVEEKEKELSIVRHKHFNARNYKKKVELRKEDERLRKQIGGIIKKEYEHFCTGVTEDIKREQIKINSGKKSIQELEKSGKSEGYVKEQKEKYSKIIKSSEKLIEKLTSQIDNNSAVEATADKIANWDPYNHNTFAEFFDSEWMFGLTKGFDIVIGNPPWGAELQPSEKELFKITYPEIDSSTPNSFAYFLGWAFKNYKSAISFVLPDSILIKDYEKTRKLIKDHVSEILWYENSGVPNEYKTFVYVDHDVCVVNLLTNKTSDLNYTLTRYIREDNSIKEFRFTSKKEKIILPEFNFAYNLIVQKNDFKILTSIKKLDLVSDFMQCHEGIHSGNCRDRLFIRNKKNKNTHPLYYGGSAGDIIENYYSSTSGWYVDYREELIDKKKGFYASLRDERIFKLPKIYLTRTGNPFKAFYDDSTYASNNFFSMQFKDYELNEEAELKLILPFIISKVAQYFIRTFAAPRLGSTFVETKIIHLLKFRVPRNTKVRSLILFLVECIICKKRNNSDSLFFERLLDAIVYELYFPEEIKAAGCEVLKHLTDLPELKDLPAGASAKEGEWSDEKKLKTIDKIYKDLSNPNHPVSIAMFKMDTVEEVRIIEGKQ
ncbi:MAG: hypothetical protein KF816_02265 [Melioribacteraceae bacterium]|nr:hypothetical protein [Melioribacteraceae bacterium]